MPRKQVFFVSLIGIGFLVLLVLPTHFFNTNVRLSGYWQQRSAIEEVREIVQKNGAISIYEIEKKSFLLGSNFQARHFKELSAYDKENIKLRICIVDTHEEFIQDQTKGELCHNEERVQKEIPYGGILICRSTKEVRYNYPLKGGTLESEEQYTLEELYPNYSQAYIDEFYRTIEKHGLSKYLVRW